MAGQAGWYRAPGEEGLLRYWNGTTWTDHRQPDPAATQPQPPSVAVETDPMAEYERQFDSSSSSLYDLRSLDVPSFSFDQRSFDVPTPVADAPSHEFAGAPTSIPRSFAPQESPVEFAPLAPISFGRPSAAPVALPASFDDATPVAEPRSSFELALREPETIVVATKPAAHREPLAIAAPRESHGAVAPSRQRVVSAARGMGIAILAILVGIGAMLFFSAQSLAGPGEAKTTGIVTSLGSTTNNSCTPIARFAVQGKSLTADDNAAISPCPVGLGQDVAIIYSSANPASSARIQLGSSLTAYLWVVPVVGFLFFLGFLTTFVVRAGSIASGIRLLREGRGKTKNLAGAA